MLLLIIMYYRVMQVASIVFRKTTDFQDKTWCFIRRDFPSSVPTDSSQEYTDSTGIDVHEFLVNTLKNNPRYLVNAILTFQN